MKPIELTEILNLHEYESQRKAIRAELVALKARRRLPVNPILTLLFENRRTVWYQVQEMVRAERMVEESVIQGELETYNPLVPGGREWKATLYIEIPDLDQLKASLPGLVGIEHSFYARCGDAAARATGEEGRSREDYTSTVHYLTFPLPGPLLENLRRSEPLSFGTDHPAAAAEIQAPADLVTELLSDLEL